ncbi:hypothetical protein [Dactylosporangium fulvum]|uniref:Uncharacterized protein n=1 Tax=Dactylosporangium fulvum TaxID=53359 RepID=A0ABY5WAS5_9ACTN|nr:hypothetical protein [Dactylosporangium fulvum]UWP86391.1 hypothetical protein Dfulv_19975 [Dactylosporangium fulvum]
MAATRRTLAAALLLVAGIAVGAVDPDTGRATNSLDRIGRRWAQP